MNRNFAVEIHAWNTVVQTLALLSKRKEYQKRNYKKDVYCDSVKNQTDYELVYMTYGIYPVTTQGNDYLPLAVRFHQANYPIRAHVRYEHAFP